MTDTTCKNCESEFAALTNARNRALRDLDAADHEVNRARARLDEIDARIANFEARRQCRDHREQTGGAR